MTHTNIAVSAFDWSRDTVVTAAQMITYVATPVVIVAPTLAQTPPTSAPTLASDTATATAGAAADAGEQANQGYDSSAAAIPAWVPGAMSVLVLLLCLTAFAKCLLRRNRRVSPCAAEEADVEAAAPAPHGKQILF